MATFATRPAKAPSRKRTGSSDPAHQPASEIQIPDEEIAKRAFEKFAGRGFVHGFDQQDWFDSEDELRAEYREQQ